MIAFWLIALPLTIILGFYTELGYIGFVIAKLTAGVFLGYKFTVFVNEADWEKAVDVGMAVGDGAVGEAGGSRDAEAAAAAAERTVPCVTGAVEHRSHGRREGRARHGSSHAKGLQRRAWHAPGVPAPPHLLPPAASPSSTSSG